MTDTPISRGTPPSDKQLAKQLGPRLEVWKSVVALIKEFEANWRWAHSEATGTWSYRAYLPGDRFFVSLSFTEGGFELSVNVRAEEWDWLPPTNAAENAFLDPLRAKATASGEDPAWLHIPVSSQDELPAIAKLLVARGRRIQAPRAKKRKR